MTAPDYSSVLYCRWRYARVPMHTLQVLWTAALEDECTLSLSGPPELRGAACIGVRYDQQTDGLKLVFTHPAWTPVHIDRMPEIRDPLTFHITRATAAPNCTIEIVQEGTADARR